MLAATSTAIAAAKAERESLKDRLTELKQRQPRAWLRFRGLEIQIDAVTARLALLEAAARAEEAQLTEDDVADAVIVFGVVLSADRTIAQEMRDVRRQLRAMSPPEFLASVEATRAARAALVNTDTVLGKYDRKTYENALTIADQVAEERGIVIPPVPAAAPKSRDRQAEW